MSKNDEKKTDDLYLCIVFRGLRGGDHHFSVDSFRRLFAQRPEDDRPTVELNLFGLNDVAKQRKRILVAWKRRACLFEYFWLVSGTITKHSDQLCTKNLIPPSKKLKLIYFRIRNSCQFKFINLHHLHHFFDVFWLKWTRSFIHSTDTDRPNFCWQ